MKSIIGSRYFTVYFLFAIFSSSIIGEQKGDAYGKNNKQRKRKDIFNESERI